MLRLALVGFAVRLALGLGFACLIAALLAFLRDGSSFGEGFRASVWIVGCLSLLLAFAGSSPAMRTGTIDPYFASFFPELTRKMGEGYETYTGPRVSPGALFVLTALVLFGLGLILG